MQLGKYSFSCLFQDEALLPEYKGSTFRGVFGHALKKIVCALKHQSCDDCLLRSRCLYALVFEISPFAADHQEGGEISVNDSGRRKPRMAAPPHPYVIEPPETDKTCFAPGDSFDFQLILFGSFNASLPYFIYAFEQMGELGIGRKINGRKARFVLDKVRAADASVYDHGKRKIETGVFTDDILPTSLSGGADLQPEDGVTQTLTVELVTPLRLKFENRLQAKLPFHILVRAMLRRVASLCAAYGDGEPSLDYRGLVARAMRVDTAGTDLRWFDWRRYSNRQDQAMLMGGLTGSVTYQGDLGAFLPLLRFCERTHLGKQTAFGLGKIKVSC
ncbi:MAG: CRISPR system precrRNA processing endoribonuclease RAMP protein Cas6 [Syntrophales bacterium]|jgi:hypothetical protein|nr:CRISPR system precrRNA processing endoribonuclease RAMP protein Cas6 [Syntrophales bacterium]